MGAEVKYLSILFFSLALTCPLVFTWTIGSILLVILLLALGTFFLRQHNKKQVRQKSEQALAGNIDWQRYNKKTDSTDIALSRIEPFFKYGIPLVTVVAFILGARAHALLFILLYIIYLWQNNSINKSPR